MPTETAIPLSTSREVRSIMAAKTFVVPLDGSEYSEQALAVAEVLADRVGGGLLLVSAPFHGPLKPREYLEEVVAKVTKCPVELLATDDFLAPAAISDALAGDDGRIVCMTTHGRGSWRWAAVGSVAEEVIRRTDRPLVLVGRQCRADFLERGHDLLVCAENTAAASALAPIVHTFADLFDLRVCVATVVHPLDVPSAEHPEDVLVPLVEALGPTVADTRLLRATYVAGALADYADDLPAALMAMKTHARTGVQRFVLGSETMAVLHHAPCPVLVVREESAAESS
jgi:nucleotide-binding universal stress UspA family protein